MCRAPRWRLRRDAGETRSQSGRWTPARLWPPRKTRRHPRSPTVGLVPAPVIIMLVLATAFSVIMRFTALGRQVYATGGNEQAAWLSGVNPSRVKLVVYTLAGAISAIAGIVAFSRCLSAEPASGFGIELDVIAAAVIGGASLSGGVGSVQGAILGAALTGIIANGVVLMNINTYAQQTITGGVILIAVSIDVWRHARKER